PAVTDLWVPIPPVVGERTDHGWSAIARLKPGVTIEQAQSEMTAVARHIEEQNPVTKEGLGVMGGALGLMLAIWGLDLSPAAIPIDLPFWMKFELDGRVLGFTASVTLLTALIFGAAPALQASQVDLNEALKEGGRSSSGAGRHQTLRSLVV